MFKRIAKRIVSTVVWLAIVGGALLFAVASLAAPSIPPAPTRDIYAQDYGDVLSRETENKINQLSTELRSRTQAQIAVVTIPSLEGEPIEEYSLALFRKWGIGDRKLNNGVLILVAVADKKARIEIGYGLEGALPDAKVGRIMDEFMRPGMETGDYNTAVRNTYIAVLQEVAAEYKQQIKTTTRTSPKNSGASADIPVWQQLLIGVGILLFLLFDWFVLGGFFTQLLLALAFSGGGRGGGSSGGGGFGGGSGGGGGANR